MRPIWEGSISFGLVNIPVRMFSGSDPHEGINLDMLHKEDHSPIRFARICRRDGEEVPWKDIIKGYKYKEGDYVVLTDKDFEKADARKTQTIDIKQFVASDDVDIRYFEKPYYLEPVSGGEKAYALLRSALDGSGRLALVRFVVHEREHIGVIKPIDQALVLNQMRFPSDLRKPTDLNFPSGHDITKEELRAALKLIEQETKKFNPDLIHDTYIEELEDIIKAKARGLDVAEHAPKPKDTSAHELMAALQASLK
jgi:DNA end-binding protein Ku